MIFQQPWLTEMDGKNKSSRSKLDTWPDDDNDLGDMLKSRGVYKIVLSLVGALWRLFGRRFTLRMHSEVSKPR